MRFSYLSIEFPALEVLRGRAITSIRANFLRAAWGAPRTQQSDNMARRGRTGVFARGEAALGFIHLLTAAGMELL
jgi:hypothetical protein